MNLGDIYFHYLPPKAKKMLLAQKEAVYKSLKVRKTLVEQLKRACEDINGTFEEGETFATCKVEKKNTNIEIALNFHKEFPEIPVGAKLRLLYKGVKIDTWVGAPTISPSVGVPISVEFLKRKEGSEITIAGLGEGNLFSLEMRPEGIFLIAQNTRIFLPH